MSIRDVLIKSLTMGFNKTAFISERKGNPSRIDVYGVEGYSILSLDITVSNSLSSGRIKKNNLRLKLEIDDLDKDLKEKIISLLEIPEYDKKRPKNFDASESTRHNSSSNLLLLKNGEEGAKAVVEFYDQQAQITGPRIYIHHCRFEGDVHDA